jgi:xanthine dehydrogenase YagR molybdenum-binding subunit
MSVMQTLVGLAARIKPDAPVDPLIDSHNYVGQPISRVDGKSKVRGKARFSAEYELDNIVHAVVVHSTIAQGRILKIDRTAAEGSDGVLKVITYENAPRIPKPKLLDPTGQSEGASMSDLKILQVADISYDGEPIAIVVAETLEQAEHAASLIRPEYEVAPADTSFAKMLPQAKAPPHVMGEPAELEHGHAEKALQEAPHHVDHTYTTPRYNHNALELHASIASWVAPDELVIFDATQYLTGTRKMLSDAFELSPKNVRVVSPFVGGGFGSKGMWSNPILCALAARLVERPVKLMLSRESVFRMVGGRTPSRQRVALGARADGKLTALIHEGVTATTTHAEFPEQFSFPTRHLWGAENFRVAQKVVHLNTVANTFMRAPGESIGTFALESAMDELAHQLSIDPVELRARNEPETDPAKHIQFSSRNVQEAYRRGAEAFGWSRRNPVPGSQRDGRWLIGLGVATATYPFMRMPGSARVRVNADGSAAVLVGAHDMGMGTATAQLQHAAERLGLPMHLISLHYGESDLPESPLAGGSNQTASIIASVTAAIDKLHADLIKKAGVHVKPDHWRDGALHNGTRSYTYQQLLQEAKLDYLDAEATSGAPLEMMKYSMHSYGAQFAEVRVHEDSGETRVTRFLGSFDAGRIVNPKLATSQFRGGIIMGIGMALTEETLFDERRGRIMNPSLAEYHVPVHLDVPPIEILWTDIPDPQAPLGVHGIGEIGITGVAAAIANAVFNATGKRIRDLPITLDKLL